MDSATPENLELTPLQQAAAERIRFFQSELAKKNIYVRLGVEQEFLIEDEKGAPVAALRRDAVPVTPAIKDPNYKDVARFIVGQGIGSLYEMEEENASNLNSLRIYEAKFDDDSGFINPQLSATPLSVALDVARFRSHGLKAALAEGTCLSSSGQGIALQPVFRSVPFPDGQHSSETIGMHMGMSVYDANGVNLLANPAIELAIAQRLLEIQHKAGLGFVQSAENASRFSANDAAPSRIGLARDKYAGTTILERGSGQGLYLENRMMGASTDPLVATALEMAAVYDVVSQNPDIAYTPPISRNALQRQWPAIPEASTEKEMAPWVKRFTDAKQEMTGLLGAALYENILTSYGKNSAPSL